MPGLLGVTKVLQVIASFGVAKVVTTVVGNTVKSAGAGTITKAAHWTGSLVIASMVCEQAKNHIERLVIKTSEEFEEAKKKAEEKAKESEEK